MSSRVLFSLATYHTSSLSTADYLSVVITLFLGSLEPPIVRAWQMC